MAEPYLAQIVDIIERLGPIAADNITIEARHFFSGAALYADGKIFASLSPAGFAVKLEDELRESLLTEHKGNEFRFFPKGPIKKEYVAISDPVLEDEQFLKELLDLSAVYVVS